MAIPKKRLEDITCQFLMLSEMLCAENGLDVYDVLQSLSNVTDEELKELNFPFKIYCKEAWEAQNKARKKRERAREMQRELMAAKQQEEIGRTSNRRNRRRNELEQRKGELRWQKI